MPASKLPDWQIDVFSAVYALAAQYGSAPDVACILRVMSALRPDLPLIAAAQARVLLHRGEATAARSLLERTDARHPTNATVKAMLSLCLYVQQDGLWEAYAEEALALPPDPAARGIIEALASAANKQLQGLASDAMVPTPLILMSGLAC